MKLLTDIHLQSGTEDLQQTDLTSSSQFFLKVHKMDQFSP